MKYLSLSILILIFIPSSCTEKNKDDKLTQDILFQLAVSATWQILLFAEGDEIGTSDFDDYVFTFLTTNVVKAADGINTYEGSWYVVDNDDSFSSTGLTFHIAFTSPETFESLTKDWDVISATQEMIRLQHVSGGDGSIDYLTFGNN